MSAILRKLLLGVALACPIASASANVIADWDAKAVAIIAPAVPAPLSQREAAMVNVAMFDAVNAIGRRYQPYLFKQDSAPETSQEAAAAAAAAAVLTGLHPEAASDIKAAVGKYLATIADSTAKTEGVRLGEAVAAAILQARVTDGATAPDAYRPKTKPGVWVPTPAAVASVWPNMRPFALASQSQFRPGPPPALDSKEWAADYNEIKAYGSKTSALRSPQQTETARFWLAVGPAAYHQIPRQLILAQKMDILDSARLMALYSVALTDAYVAVFDAKYHYEFWRPITAIRNGDIEENATNKRDATWQPIDNTPMHPEYPCAHCINAAAGAAVLEGVLGSRTIPEVAMTSTAAPGVTHRFTDLDALCEEVSNARVWAGFHYRSSAAVGTAMGRQIGEYVVQNVMQPTTSRAVASGGR
ncbi:vanadium-dependent haloperoxidase [Bradyrhizobium lablabi]|uniref:vanadium-dependent haloperoxidase n=1 Tax=Bradyrhizobium lablabi TaxID=722472 RepID=UPI0020134C96|nr:vanadium-dependent haloperoxidase [Bradyrhizobium lablabi]